MQSAEPEWRRTSDGGGSDAASALRAPRHGHGRTWSCPPARTALTAATNILVDDGIATGVTVRAALLGLQRCGAARRVLAAPVAPPEVAEALRPSCDEAVFLDEPELFYAVGAFYDDFHQVSDAEVIELLDEAASSRRTA